MDNYALNITVVTMLDYQRQGWLVEAVELASAIILWGMWVGEVTL